MKGRQLTKGDIGSFITRIKNPKPSEGDFFWVGEIYYLSFMNEDGDFEAIYSEYDNGAVFFGSSDFKSFPVGFEESLRDDRVSTVIIKKDSDHWVNIGFCEKMMYEVLCRVIIAKKMEFINRAKKRRLNNNN
jgi:hypothetical protein